MAKKKTATPTYESAMAELQEIVNLMQEEALGVDELAEKAKRAAELIAFCKEKLRGIEGELGEWFG